MSANDKRERLRAFIEKHPEDEVHGQIHSGIFGLRRDGDTAKANFHCAQMIRTCFDGRFQNHVLTLEHEPSGESIDVNVADLVAWSLETRPTVKLGAGGPYPPGEYLLTPLDETAHRSVAEIRDAENGGQPVLSPCDVGHVNCRAPILAPDDALGAFVLPDRHGEEWTAHEFAIVLRLHRRLVGLRVHGSGQKRVADVARSLRRTQRSVAIGLLQVNALMGEPALPGFVRAYAGFSGRAKVTAAARAAVLAYRGMPGGLLDEIADTWSAS